MSSELLVRASGLGKRYRSAHWVLRDAAFEIRRGEMVGVVGRNGSGKTTLLQLVCGLLAPTEGAVTAFGKIAALLELGTGFDPEFTGRENVYLNASIMGLSRRQIDARYSEIVRFAGIGDCLDEPVKTYSSGMVMRLAFAVMAHVDAELLIIDEALAVGDAPFVQKCMRFLREFRGRGAVLFASHDLAAVVSLCGRAIWLSEGRVEVQGPAKAVCESYIASLCDSEERGTLVPSEVRLGAFCPDARSFGKRNVEITAAGLLDQRHEILSWFEGGEQVTLFVRVRAFTKVASPIVGFAVKDRLGQVLFGDNTYLTCAQDPRVAEAGESFEARFAFQMPALPPGDYSIGLAAAEGSQADHIQQHWIHDAIFFKSRASNVWTGLVRIPMRSISLVVVPRAPEKTTPLSHAAS